MLDGFINVPNKVNCQINKANVAFLKPYIATLENITKRLCESPEINLGTDIVDTITNFATNTQIILTKFIDTKYMTGPSDSEYNNIHIVHYVPSYTDYLLYNNNQCTNFYNITNPNISLISLLLAPKFIKVTNNENVVSVSVSNDKYVMLDNRSEVLGDFAAMLESAKEVLKELESYESPCC